jgi:hypothetical protein
VERHPHSRWAAGYLTGIKQLEGHPAVRRLTTFWAGYFRGPQAPSLFDQPPDTRLRFGRLAEFPVDRGIDDAAWKPLEASSDPGDNDLGTDLPDRQPESVRRGRRRRR